MSCQLRPRTSNIRRLFKAVVITGIILAPALALQIIINVLCVSSPIPTVTVLVLIIIIMVFVFLLFTENEVKEET